MWKRDAVMEIEDKLKKDNANLSGKSFNDETKAVLIKGAKLAGADG